MSTACSKNDTNIWIDDPIILPDTASNHSASILNTTSLEACQEMCLNVMEDRCSAVQYSSSSNCTIYPRNDWHSNKVISPVPSVEMWRTRVCLTGKLQLQYRHEEIVGTKLQAFVIFNKSAHYLWPCATPTLSHKSSNYAQFL